MTTTTTPTTAAAAGGDSASPGARARRIGLGLVMLGALSVSVRGQVEAVWPLLGAMSIVLALTNDVAALLALNEVISTRRVEVRRWAWAVLLLAGGTTAGLNTWHALDTGRLPPLWAIVVGAGPVLLSMVLSHLVALASTPDTAATTNRATTAEAAARTPTGAAAAAQRPPVAVPAAIAQTVPAGPAASTSRAGQVAPALPGPGTHTALSVVGRVRVLPPETPHTRPDDTAAVAGDRRVAELVAQLRTGAALTGAEVGQQLGCSPRTGRRLLGQAQHLLGAEPPQQRRHERGTG